jgi:hypothetical protein
MKQAHIKQDVMTSGATIDNVMIASVTIASVTIQGPTTGQR